MKLFLSDTSPYARKIVILIRMLGIEAKTEKIYLRPLDNPPELFEVNPLGRVPALVTETGCALPDSALITDFLLCEYDGAHLLPREDTTRWEILRLANLAEGIIDLGVLIVMENRKPQEMIHRETIDRRTQGILRTLESLNGDDWQLSTDRPTVYEITLACALAFLDDRLPQIDWRAVAPALNDWYGQARSADWFVSTQTVD